MKTLLIIIGCSLFIGCATTPQPRRGLVNFGGAHGLYDMALIMENETNKGKTVGLAILPTLNGIRKIDPRVFDTTLNKNVDGLMISFLGYFSGNDKFSIVERANLEPILEEKHLQMTGITREQLQEIGTLSKATHIMSFDIMYYDKRMEYSGHLWSVETGNIVGAYSCIGYPNKKTQCHY